MGAAACTVPVKFAQWFYFAGFILSLVACWLLRDHGDQWLDFSPLNQCLSDTSPPDRACMGQQAVIAVSFGTFCFFSLHFLLLLGVTHRANWRLPLHTGFWPIKFLLWGGAIAGLLFAPASVLEGFGQAARVFAGLFILLQLVIILDFIYAVNEWLLERDGCGWALVAGSALGICGSFVGIGFLYAFWAPSASCSLNIWFITSIILMFLLYGAISVSPLRPDSAGLFTSAAVLTYTAYYCWSALNSEPLSHACANSSAGGNRTIQIIGFVVAILALGYSTMSGATSSSAFDLTTACADEEELPHRPDFFHAMFGLASCYMAMIYVGWDLTGDDTADFQIDRGWGSTWVKMAASWLAGVLYTWSLIAHRVLKNRTF